LCLPPGAPVNLWSVAQPDDGDRPKLPLYKLAAIAIYGSEKRRLTLQGIIQAIYDRFPSFRDPTDFAWTRTLRHELSLRAVFVNVDRPSHHAGKGNYWMLTSSSSEILKRPRKR
ncbi:hypothetical protein B0H11DRAFT_1656835, partial [Mycena galericulata]